MTVTPSLRANGSRDARPDDRLREAIQRFTDLVIASASEAIQRFTAQGFWIASSLTLLAKTERVVNSRVVGLLPCANASRLSQAMTVTPSLRAQAKQSSVAAGKDSWIASSLTLLAKTGRVVNSRFVGVLPCANASRLSQAMTVTPSLRAQAKQSSSPAHCLLESAKANGYGSRQRD
jgi:hypothetical protein